MDKTLTDAGASKKSRVIFRAIYRVATGMARVKGIDGETIYTQEYKIRIGVIQGDIISPILFILAIDQIMQKFDKGGPGKGGARGHGFKCGHILRIKVLGYADDAALVDNTVAGMTKRLVRIGDTSQEEADMKINLHATRPRTQENCSHNAQRMKWQQWRRNTHITVTFASDESRQ